MMVYVKWGLRAIFWTAVVAFLHYTLPQHDIVRVTDTYERRITPGDNALFWSNADTGNAQQQSEGRDVFFIQSFLNDNKPMVYRNEDTGWGWPPYFKFDSSNLQAQASDAKTNATGQEAQWMRMLHYGWRNEFLSIYPNAISITPASGPDARVIPWFNIVVLTLLAMLYWAVRVRWNRFWARRDEPEGGEWREAAD